MLSFALVNSLNSVGKLSKRGALPLVSLVDQLAVVAPVGRRLRALPEGKGEKGYIMNDLPEFEYCKEPVEYCRYCGKALYLGEATHGIENWEEFAVCEQCLHD